MRVSLSLIHHAPLPRVRRNLRPRPALQKLTRRNQRRGAASIWMPILSLDSLRRRRRPRLLLIRRKRQPLPALQASGRGTLIRGAALISRPMLLRDVLPPHSNTGSAADVASVVEKSARSTPKSGSPRLSVTQLHLVNPPQESAWSRNSDVIGSGKGSTMLRCNVSPEKNISGSPECNDDMKRRMR